MLCQEGLLAQSCAGLAAAACQLAKVGAGACPNCNSHRWGHPHQTRSHPSAAALLPPSKGASWPLANRTQTVPFLFSGLSCLRQHSRCSAWLLALANAHVLAGFAALKKPFERHRRTCCPAAACCSASSGTSPDAPGSCPPTYLTPMTDTLTPRGVRTISFTCKMRALSAPHSTAEGQPAPRAKNQHAVLELVSGRGMHRVVGWLHCRTGILFSPCRQVTLQVATTHTFRPNSLKAAVSNAGSFAFFLPPA